MRILFALAAVCLSSSAFAQERGSVAGDGTSVLSTSALGSGLFYLPSTIDVPSEEGGPLWNVFPTYSPGAGLSEWGMGWQSILSITRGTNTLTGPWGVMKRDVDLNWVTPGYSTPVKVIGVGSSPTTPASSYVAYLPDGRVATFLQMPADGNLPNTTYWLSSVTDPVGNLTSLHYSAHASLYGKELLLDSMTYGGAPNTSTPTDTVSFEYQTLDSSNAGLLGSYFGGARSALAHRVTGVTMVHRNGLRWNYALTYKNNPVTPIFYLSTVTKTFASGQSLPPVTYTYNINETSTLPSATLKRDSASLSLLQGYHVYAAAMRVPTPAQPTGAVFGDINNDGLTGFITNALTTDPIAFFQFAQTTPGSLAFTNLFHAYSHGVTDPLTDVTTDTSPGLMIGYDLFVQREVNPPDPSPISYANGPIPLELVNQPIANPTPSNPRGQPEVDIFTGQLSDVIAGPVAVPGLGVVYATAPTVTGDPAILAVYTGPSSTSFYPPEIVGPADPGTIDFMNGADFNGDGLVDIIYRMTGSAALSVYVQHPQELGVGTYQKSRVSFVTLPNSLGWPGSADDILLLDANRDGLTDIVAVPSTNLPPRLFLNVGSVGGVQTFSEFFVPALANAAAPAGQYVQGVAQDLVGDGNAHLRLFYSPPPPWMQLSDVEDVTFSVAGDGLLANLDDGTGNSTAYTYTRPPVQQGAPYRPVVLQSATVTSFGDVPRLSTFSFLQFYNPPGAPPSAGFNSVDIYTSASPASANSPMRHDHIGFLANPDVPGLMQSHTSDSTVDTLTESVVVGYASANINGVVAERVVSKTTSTGTGNASVDSTDTFTITAYDPQHPFCPNSTQHVTASGKTINSTYAFGSPFLNSFACLSSSASVSGATALDLDAPLYTTMQRNDAGQITMEIEGGGPDGTGAGALTTQVAYSNGLPTRVTYPNDTSRTYTYGDATSPVPTQILQPDGSVVDLHDRDAVTREQRSVTRNGFYTQYSTYDGMERSLSSWDNVHAGSQFNPLRSLSYSFPTASQPGIVTSTSLVDASGIVTQSAALFGSNGAALATAVQTPTAWFIGAGRTIDTPDGSTTSYVSTATGATPLNAFTHAVPVSLGNAVVSPLGFPVSQTSELPGGVQASTNFAYTAGNHQITTTATAVGVSPAAVRTIVSDVSGATHSYRDEAFAAGAYTYDGLGRLKTVALPDQVTVITIVYDDHGRVLSVVRIGTVPMTVTYEYNAFGLVAKNFTNGGAQRHDFFDYDPKGRLRTQLSTTGATLEAMGAQTEAYLYYYDGATLENATLVTPSQQGFLTGVAGPGYDKQFVYAADGALAHEVLNLGDYTVASDFTYFDNGALRTQSSELISLAASQACFVEQPTNDPNHTYASREILLDAYGRPSGLLVNGGLFANLEYDALNRVSSVLTSDGSATIPTYDATTLAQVGVTRYSADGVVTSSGVTYDARGKILTETLANAASVVTRTYAYNPNQSLASFRAGTNAPIAFSYNSDTYLQSAPAHTDAFGRVTSRTANGITTQFSYNAHGQLSGACVGSAGCTPTVTFTYDESGQRLVRRVNGAFNLAYTDAGVIDSGVTDPVQGGGTVNDGGGLTQTIDLAGWHLGTLRKGVFTSLATDARGTVLGELKKFGISGLPNPYGAGAVVLSSANVTSYAEQPLDATLGLVRMGVRDYDTATGQFLQPDPLYLENPALCIGDHVGCNLYSYAGNDPVNRTDPSGMKYKMNVSSLDGDGGFGDIAPSGVFTNPGAWTPGGLMTGTEMGGNVSCDLFCQQGVQDRNAATMAANGMYQPSVAQQFSASANAFVNGLKNIPGDLGKLWSSVNTIIGLGYAVIGEIVALLQGAPDVRLNVSADHNAIEVTGNPLQPGGRATTFGNVVTYGAGATSADAAGTDNGDSNGPMWQHEEQHTYQGQMVGPAYLPLNIVFGVLSTVITGRWWSPINVMESGPQQTPPRPWQ